ncbi:MAG: NAD(P)H-dependent oxidoreductase [Ignavibacteriaceae bacterium]|jgi:FMN reductase
MVEKKNEKRNILVVGLSGSLRVGSYTSMAVNIALLGAKEVGVKTEFIDLNKYNLAFCDGRKDFKSYPVGVLKLKTIVEKAQGIILGTPEYHAGFSGVLKNALDLMGFTEFEGKMIGLIGVSGGKMGAANALNSLRNVGRALHAWLIPEQVSIVEAWKNFDKTGNITDKLLENRVKDVGRQVARFAYLHSSEKTKEFVKEWEGAPENPGG